MTKGPALTNRPRSLDRRPDVSSFFAEKEILLIATGFDSENGDQTKGEMACHARAALRHSPKTDSRQQRCNELHSQP
jgi:hypothetical protein